MFVFLNTMQFKLPKSDKYQWTKHSIFKMRQYGLSQQRVIRVICNPERTEIGVAKNTIAVMQPAGVKCKNFKKTWNQEIWAMYQIKNSKSEARNSKQLPNIKIQNSKLLLAKKLKIISAWRYPGVSPKNNPIPEEILREIGDIN